MENELTLFRYSLDKLTYGKSYIDLVIPDEAITTIDYDYVTRLFDNAASSYHFYFSNFNTLRIFNDSHRFILTEEGHKFRKNALEINSLTEKKFEGLEIEGEHPEIIYAKRNKTKFKVMLKLSEEEFKQNIELIVKCNGNRFNILCKHVGPVLVTSFGKNIYEFESTAIKTLGNCA